MNENKCISRKLGYEKIYHYALEFFCFDKDKTNAWWINKNETLNNLSPFEMVKEGKGRELMKILSRCA